MKRVVTAIALLIVSLYLIFLAPQAVFVAGALSFALFCFREFDGLVGAHDIAKPGFFGLLCGVSLIFVPQFALPVVALVMVASFIRALRFPDLRHTLAYAGCVLLAAFYTFAPWRFAIELRDKSVHLLFFALALNWAGDSLAYYGGRAFGKHKLAPIVSPKKTWEGAAISVVGSIVFGLLYLGHFLPSIRLWQIVVVSVLANVAGQFGDLAESALKRGAGVKDSSNLLPGHGGMLDRLDSSLFALPVVYVLIRVFATLN
jgi:phosphatidate cytidylyltransferase